ncbi:hypothetical protein GCM10009416_35680 [Craurococcus roseus]|uniref:histidine kinase n=1 Tax=Craurococcus roseus TaxID=77585 RepID=A0ABN1FMW3_9PROT
MKQGDFTSSVCPDQSQDRAGEATPDAVEQSLAELAAEIAAARRASGGAGSGAGAKAEHALGRLRLELAAERARAEARRALLIGELNHRVKNTLAVVQSLAAQTARGAPDLPSFAAAFQARLLALARAHDLLTRRDWEGAPMVSVVRAAVEPCGSGRVDLRAGRAPSALLAPAQVLTLALALHELATNALRHGALSEPGGRVSVCCGPDPAEEGAQRVVWAERDGPPIPAPPVRKGFGLRLLERGLAGQAGMEAETRFEPEGLRCALRLRPAGPALQSAMTT